MNREAFPELDSLIAPWAIGPTKTNSLAMSC